MSEEMKGLLVAEEGAIVELLEVETDEELRAELEGRLAEIEEELGPAL